MTLMGDCIATYEILLPDHWPSAMLAIEIENGGNSLLTLSFAINTFIL